MKPNDKAIEAARAAILKAIAERNCIIAGVQFNENNYDEFDASEAVEHSKVALEAAYAAQFQSGDYADVIKSLRVMHDSIITDAKEQFRDGIHETMPSKAADAIEALLAEREALNFELAARKEWPQARAEMLEELAKVRAERDALAARLAPVGDKELVEIAVNEMRKQLPASVPASGVMYIHIASAARSAISAIRPHIEAAEREKLQKMLARMGAGTTKTGAVNE